jgi:thiol-disulfide isomerase/thioredoxin
MNSKLKWILILCGLVILIGGAYVAYDRLAPLVEDMRTGEVSSPADTKEGDEAAEASSTAFMVPRVALYDAEGNSVSLPDLIDKPTILNFWASTCNPCASEMPHFQAVYKELGDEYNFVFINYVGFYGETEESALDFLEANGYTFTTYFDRNQSAAYAFGISSIPCTAFIAADGEFLGGILGAMNEDTLRSCIEEYFG